MTKAVSNLSDEELTALADSLAQERTAIRERQNEVSQQQEVRKALGGMSEATRKLVLSGKLDGKGGMS